MRLAGLVAQLLPEDDEVHGLRALLLLQHARRAGRGAEAAAAYRGAFELVRAAAERRFLERRLREIAAGS